MQDLILGQMARLPDDLFMITVLSCLKGESSPKKSSSDVELLLAIVV